MPTNPFFNQVTHPFEQGLLQDLQDESIKIHGHEVYYIPRDVINLDTILGEDDLQLFQTAYPIEMYIKTHASFQGQSEFVSKFGLIIEDRIDLSVSVRRFHQAVPNMLRPREGDLIWIQMAPGSRFLFDIRFVENMEQMFQLGKLYTYELRCERMNFSHERLKTPEPIINKATERDAYTIDLMLTTGSGNYLYGETVRQGDATGMVADYSSIVGLLSLQNIVGTFVTGEAVVGQTSGASWVVGTIPTLAPEAHDPISDNQELGEEETSIVVVRGTNPRFN